MLKKLFFYCFGSSFNMGSRVRLADIPGMNAIGSIEALMGENESFRAPDLLRTQIASTELGEFLKTQGPYLLEYETRLDWGNINLLDWYQHPSIRATLTGVRFMNKPTWLQLATPQPA